MHQYSLYLLLLCLVACSPKETLVDVSVKSKVFAIIEAEKNIQGLNSVAFCVVKNDEILWMDAIGMADHAAQRIATNDTRYLVASISKTVTAVAAMQLYEQGLLDLDADVMDYVPFEVRNPAFPNLPITTRMLLTHASSISDDHMINFDLAGFGFDHPQSIGDLLHNFFTVGGDYYSSKNYYNYAPATQGNYTNIGSTLVGYIVERVSQQPFEEYCKANIFLPLGMEESAFSLAATPLEKLAVPYSPFSMNATASPHYAFSDLPAGSLRTTARDLSKFQRALILDGSFNGQQLLQPSTLDLMKTPTYSFSRGSFDFEHGLGMYYRTIGNLRLLGHGGGDMGITSEMLYDPNTNVGVVVITNTTSIIDLDLIVNTLIQFGNQQ